MDAARMHGGPLPPADQLKALRRITRAAQMARSNPGTGPAFMYAFYLGLGAFVLGYLVLGELAASPFATGFACAAVVAGGVLLTVRRRPWSAVVYELLADYRPLNEASYRRLQDQARQGTMTPDAVLEWAQIERDSIQPPRPTATARARARFLEK